MIESTLVSDAVRRGGPPDTRGSALSKRAALLTVPLALIAFTAACTDEGAPAPAASVAPAAVPLTDVRGQDGWATLVKPCGTGELISIEKVKTADVTGDGVRDPFVARACEGADLMGPATIEVFNGASTTTVPQRIGTLLGDVAKDKPVLTKLTVDKEVVLVEASGVDEASDATCPEVTFTYRYRFAGDTFTREERKVTPDPTCQADDA